MDTYLKLVDDDSSDDEMLLSVMRSCAEELDREAGEGSSQGPRRPPRARIYIRRDREGAAERIHRDYFAEQPTFSDYKFKRRYRMQPQLFERIVADNFCLCVSDLYQDEYLRKRTARDIQRIYETHKTRHGLGGCLGASIACIGNGRIVLLHGSNNDIIVLNRPPLFDSIKNGSAPPSPFTATLIKAYSSPTDEPSAKFTRFQESARKDVERTFGVLQGRFNILRVPGRAWRAKKMHRILYCCVLLHNMIQEDNGFAITSLDEEYLREPENRPVFVRNRNTTRAAREKEIRDKDVHNALRADLTEHIWNLPLNYRRAI
ncbi:uncharacterized protein [Rutidosis leptorrhynchoides]|uniref:uncharacterized protein n=1 Tax=Rutidosis leptorrhynchoides TaxID=125765 RepID=UPI003A9A3A96